MATSLVLGPGKQVNRPTHPNTTIHIRIQIHTNPRNTNPTPPHTTRSQHPTIDRDASYQPMHRKPHAPTSNQQSAVSHHQPSECHKRRPTEPVRFPGQPTHPKDIGWSDWHGRGLHALGSVARGHAVAVQPNGLVGLLHHPVSRAWLQGMLKIMVNEQPGRANQVSGRSRSKRW